MTPKLQRNLPLFGTISILLLLLTIASLRYPHFFSLRNGVDILAGQAGMGVIAVGMTLVIFSGGIDLSVGAVAGCSTIMVATLVEQHGFPPAVAAAIVLAAGAAFGAGMGTLIQVFKQPPFLITLAGMFFARGCGFWISIQSIEFKNPAIRSLVDFTWQIGDDTLHPLPMLLFLGVFGIGCIVAHHTRYGRNLLAIGGNEQSALLMGLPVGTAKITAYTICGATAALGGLTNSLITGSAYPRYGIGIELDAIAAVVIGGAILTGGRGQMPGTLCGVVILGTIKAALDFDGHLDPAWTRIIIGGLLLGFILLQRVMLGRLERRG